MGVILDRAMEHDGLLLNEVALLFAGSSTPEVDEPDAPQGSVYYRSNGERYTRTASTGSGVAEDWVREDPAATEGGGIVALSWRFSTSTVIANPGSKRIRYDNATPASVTQIAVSDTTNGNFDASLILNELTNGDKLFIQESGVSANFLFGTVTAVTDNTGWFTIDITVTSSGTLPANNKDVAFFIIKAGGGGAAVFPEFQFFADHLDNPNNADWTVNALAPAVADSNNNGLTVRLFDDTTEQGVGFEFEVPATATNIIVKLRGKAETAPPAARTVGVKLYNRGMPDDAAVEAWSAGLVLDDVDIPTNGFFQYDSQTITLASLGITAGEMTQFELTRVAPTAGTNLVGDWGLKLVKVGFS